MVHILPLWLCLLLPSLSNIYGNDETTYGTSNDDKTCFNGTIIDDICQCDIGFYGYTCREICKCNESNTLTCSKDGSCECRQGFYGDFCEKICPCQNNGTCKEDGTCKCPDTYYGDTCAKECGCNSNGSSNPSCDPIDGKCDCYRGYFGRTCEDCKCNKIGSILQHCHNNGSCTCVSSHFGPKCEKCNCSNHSYKCDPITGKCDCFGNYTGENCEIPIDDYCQCDKKNSFYDICNTISKQCPCRSGFYGPRCQKECNCPSNTQHKNHCDVTNGQCICETNYGGLSCNISLKPCTLVGSLLQQRDINEKCICKKFYVGKECDIECNCSRTLALDCIENGTCLCKNRLKDCSRDATNGENALKIQEDLNKRSTKGFSINLKDIAQKFSVQIISKNMSTIHTLIGKLESLQDCLSNSIPTIPTSTVTHPNLQCISVYIPKTSYITKRNSVFRFSIKYNIFGKPLKEVEPGLIYLQVYKEKDFQFRTLPINLLVIKPSIV